MSRKKSTSRVAEHREALAREAAAQAQTGAGSGSVAPPQAPVRSVTPAQPAAQAPQAPVRSVAPSATPGPGSTPQAPVRSVAPAQSPVQAQAPSAAPTPGLDDGGLLSRALPGSVPTPPRTLGSVGGSSAGGGAGAPVRSSYPEGGGDPDDYSGDYNDAGVDDGAPASVQDRRAGVRPKRPASAHVRRVLSSKGAFFVGVAVLVVAACAVIGFGYPAVGHSWKWPVALGGTLGVAVLGFLLWRARPHLSRRSLLITGVAAALVVLIFSLGAGHSVVLNGKVYPSTSKTAQAYVMSEELRRDLYTIASYDRLLTYNLTDARAHYSEYATAIADMQAMTNKWGNQSLNNLPDPNLIAAITNTKVAANYTADALQAQQQLLTVTDPQLVAQVTSDRETVANSAIAAAHALVNVANDYGFALYGQVHE